MALNRNQKIVLVIFALFALGIFTRRTEFDSKVLGGCVIFGVLLYVARDKER